MLRLWIADPSSVLPQEVALKCSEMLSVSERSRLKAIRPGRARQEYLIAHCLVRRALSHCYPIAPEAWEFRTNPYGKPRIDPDCGICFNLSHSADLVVCLTAQSMEVGVDVEHCERAAAILEIAGEVFSPLELAQLNELRTAERLNRALSLWTLKEAYVKAQGMGLSLPLKNISMVFGGAGGILLQLDSGDKTESERWQFCLLEQDAHRIALVTEKCEDTQLELWKIQPVLGDPKRLAVREATWFPLTPR